MRITRIGHISQKLSQIAVFYLTCITRYKYASAMDYSFGQIKIILLRKEITELYRICDMQRFQIAVTILRRQL